MSAWDRRGWGPRLLAVALVAGLGAAGCGKKPEPAPQYEETPATPAPAEHKAEPAVKPAVSEPAAPAPAKIVRDRLHQSFADATIKFDNTPPDFDVEPPVSKTSTGKSAVALCEQVAQTWDSVRFTTADGKRIDYVVELSTSRGVIKLAILPELAPNHARNFIVLARLGYYDGLRFDRIRHEQGKGDELHWLEAGSPDFDADRGTGSIGYWMKNEHVSGEKCTHTEGVVGAYCEVEPDGAATMFYVNLGKSPSCDGHYSIFAQVMEGLDVLRTMSKVAATPEPNNSDRLRPNEPIVIHKATVSEMVAGDEK
jgi:peptidylprolyl isomerase